MHHGASAGESPFLMAKTYMYSFYSHFSHVKKKKSEILQFSVRTSTSDPISRALPLNLQRVTEALLLYDCGEGGHVPSVDAHVQGDAGKSGQGSFTLPMNR